MLVFIIISPNYLWKLWIVFKVKERCKYLCMNRYAVTTHAQKVNPVLQTLISFALEVSMGMMNLTIETVNWSYFLSVADGVTGTALHVVSIVQASWRLDKMIAVCSVADPSQALGTRPLSAKKSFIFSFHEELGLASPFGKSRIRHWYTSDISALHNQKNQRSSAQSTGPLSFFTIDISVKSDGSRHGFLLIGANYLMMYLHSNKSQES